LKPPDAGKQESHCLIVSHLSAANGAVQTFLRRESSERTKQAGVVVG